MGTSVLEILMRAKYKIDNWSVSYFHNTAVIMRCEPEKPVAIKIVTRHSDTFVTPGPASVPLMVMRCDALRW